MQYKEFLRSVWRWKYTAAFIWMLLAYIPFLLGVSFIKFIFRLQIRSYFLYISILMIPLLLHTYYNSITVLPLPSTVLKLNQIGNRLLWFLAQFTFVFLNCMAFISIVKSIIYALIISYFLITQIKFSVHIPSFIYTNDRRHNRLDELKDTYIFPSIPVMFIVILSIGGGSLWFIIAAPMFYIITDIFIRVIEISAGEPVSFASDEETRMSQGLKSKGLEKLWAYGDFLLAVTDERDTRRKLLFQSSGERWNGVVDSLSASFDAFVEAQLNIADDGDVARYPLTRLNDGAMTKDQKGKISNVPGRSRPLTVGAALRSPLEVLRRIQSRLRSAQAAYASRCRKVRAFCRAMDGSVEVLAGVRSVRGVVRAVAEDEHGHVQARLGELLDKLLSVERLSKANILLQWPEVDYGAPKRYGGDAVLRTPDLILREIHEATKETLAEIIGRYGYKLDFGKVSQKNEEELAAFVDNV